MAAHAGSELASSSRCVASEADGTALLTTPAPPTPEEYSLTALDAGDVLLVANAGAYGHAMSSRYTLREPAEELCI